MHLREEEISNFRLSSRNFSILVSYISILFLVSLAVSVFCEEMVLTPGGYYPKSCVHQVSESDAVVRPLESGHVHIEYSDGTKKVIPPCSRERDILANGHLDEQEGWVAYTYWEAPSVVTSYVVTWTVPPNPTTLDTQTLFTFTGLQNDYTFSTPNGPRQGVSIIQPVLQWGPSEAGGGSYWSIASWWVGSNAVWSPIKKVSSGDIILGTMVYNGNQTWSIIARDQTSKVSTTLNVKVGVQEHYAFVSLEVYNVATCGDYPNGVIPYTGLVVKNKGKVLSPKWQKEVINQCNEAVQIQSASTVTIKF